MADQIPCPDGLPWCTRHWGGRTGLHQSEHRDLPLRHRRTEYGNASACALQLADDPGSRVTASVQAGGPFWPDGTRSERAYLPVQDAAAAEVLARFLEWMAMATPAQHRTLAAQVRAASAVAFRSPEAEDRND